MKIKKKFINALNILSGLHSSLALGENEKELRYRLSPYGEYPVTDETGNKIMQVIDQEAANAMAQNFTTLASKIANMFKGIPIYEGHADNARWSEQNPGHKASAIGRIKSIEAGDDGIYVTSVFNSEGAELISGEAPKYSGHSPHWRLTPIAGRPGYYRPVILWSDALTNTPNIVDNIIAMNSADEIDIEEFSEEIEVDETDEQSTNMKLTASALKILGLLPEAQPTAEEISAAVEKLFSQLETERAAKVTAEGDVTAANSRIGTIEGELTQIRSHAVDIVVLDAINSGRITEAQKPQWVTALNTSFASEHAKLINLVPVLNTASKLGNVSRTVDVANSGDIADQIRAYGKANNIDVTNSAGWDKAFQGWKNSQPVH